MRMSRIVYLECRENNHDKFYLMTEYSAGTTFVARWGRIGTEGSSRMYSMSDWHKMLNKRLSHGYVDRTQDYLDGKIKDSVVWTGVGEAKYKMSGTRKNWLGHELYKIVAAKTFETVEGYEVQAGETGGWIEKPENLDQDGQCWVADEAIVFGSSACVKDNALVADKAVCAGSVCEDAVVRGEALIKSEAICMGHSLICDSAIVQGIVRGYATVAEKAIVKEGTLVEGDTYYIQS